MSDSESKIFFARNLNELFYHIKTIQDLRIIGGCTRLERMPEKAISTTGIPELCQITKHERFIEFGPGVTLSEILALGERHIPHILYEATKDIANPFVRNIATIGGNICSSGHKLSLYAPLLALDTQLEFRTSTDTSYVSLLNFRKIPDNAVLTKIRIPISDWDVALYYRLGPDSRITENSATFSFLADTEKNIITNIRIALAGKIVFRSINLENRMLGLKLPLTDNDVNTYVSEAALQFDNATEDEFFNPILRNQFLNLMRCSLEQLT